MRLGACRTLQWESKRQMYVQTKCLLVPESGEFARSMRSSRTNEQFERRQLEREAKNERIERKELKYRWNFIPVLLGSTSSRSQVDGSRKPNSHDPSNVYDMRGLAAITFAAAAAIIAPKPELPVYDHIAGRTLPC